MKSEAVRILISVMALFLSPLLLIFGAFIGIAALEIDNPIAFDVPELRHQSPSTLSIDPAVEGAVFGSEKEIVFPPEKLAPPGSPLPRAATVPEVIEPEPEKEPIPSVRGSSVPTVDLSLLSGIDSENRYELLRLHNSARAEVGAPPLLWSSALSESAQIWSTISASEGCELAHSGTSFGEVVYYSKKTGDDTTPRSGSEVMGEFLEEEKYYDSSDHTCERGKICGHYTQIVWADTTEVGCGMAACVAPGVREEIWTCHYSPAGNVDGQIPF